MFETSFLPFFLLAYLFGSIPTSVWVGKIFYNIDVRNFGSGNAGATNTFRVLGAKAAIPVLLLDVLKGAAASYLVFFYPSLNPDTSAYVIAQILLGICAILGHLWPVFAQFKGGKGVATMFGMVLVLQPIAALLAFLIFGIVFFVTHFVSLASIIASFAFGLFTILVFNEDRTAMIVFCFIVICVILYTHRKNVTRLLKGVEPKVHLTKKNKFN